MTDEKRFEKIHSGDCGFLGPATTILVDKQTGVNYLFVQGVDGAGLTPLLNRDGSPVVTAIPSRYRE